MTMSLNLQKLEKVRELAGGIVQARCPACAEGGADKTGNHLRIQADGRFGCCVHPKDTEHRKRIFALVGVRDRQPICVKVAAPQVAKIIQSDVLGRLGRVFATPPQPAAPNITTLGTLGTPTYSNAYAKNNSSDVVGLYMEEFCSGVPSVPELPLSPDFKTPVPSVPALEVPPDSQTGVPSVPTPCGGPPLPPAAGEKLPFLTAGGDLSIPFDSPERYHWWKPDGVRLSVAETLAEVKERMNLCR